MAQDKHLHPAFRFLQLLSLDRWEIVVIGCFALTSGLLTLAVPVAAQALVNTIAQGLFIQPLIVLTGAVFIGLAFSGILKSLHFIVSERVQHRLFARLALRLTDLLRKLEPQPFLAQGGVEKINYFFEIANVQKSWQKLLLDVPVALVDMLLSLAFLAFYGSTLWMLSLGVLGFSAVIIFLLGFRGLTTSIYESKAKYRLADWLQEMAHNFGAPLRSSPSSYWLKTTDEHVCAYLKYRRSHFNVLLRQTVAFYALRAVVTSLFLGLGGWLVVQKQLSVGQLVAAEIVLLNLLKASEKHITSTASYYHLLTGLDKLGHLNDLPEADPGTVELPASTQGLQVVARSLSFQYSDHHKLIDQICFSVEPGERVSLVGAEGSGKSTLAALLAGQLMAPFGSLEFDGIDAELLRKDSWASQVAWLNDREELFEGSLEENLRLGRSSTPHDLRWALQVSGLHEHLPWLPRGLKSDIAPAGRNLANSQIERLLLARAVLTRPRLMLMDRPLESLDPERLRVLIKQLFDKANRWTLINFWVHAEALIRSDRLLVLYQGTLVQTGSPLQLASDPDSYLARLFPVCTAAILRLQENGHNV